MVLQNLASIILKNYFIYFTTPPLQYIQHLKFFFLTALFKDSFFFIFLFLLYLLSFCLFLFLSLHHSHLPNKQQFFPPLELERACKDRSLLFTISKKIQIYLHHCNLLFSILAILAKKKKEKKKKVTLKTDWVRFNPLFLPRKKNHRPCRLSSIYLRFQVGLLGPDPILQNVF